MDLTTSDGVVHDASAEVTVFAGPAHSLVLALAVAFVAGSLGATVITLRDSTLTRAAKLYWVLVLWLVPVLGLAVWILGRRSRAGSRNPALN